MQALPALGSTSCSTMGTVSGRRASSTIAAARPRRRKREDGAGPAARAAGEGGGGGGGGGTTPTPNQTPTPRPLISGPAPFQMPRWPLPPLGDNVDATTAATTSTSPTAAELARSRLWVALDGAIADARSLGVPRSALPNPQEGASAEELAAAIAHVEDVVASFLSANI